MSQEQARPSQPEEADAVVRSIAARNRLSVEETSEMLDGFTAALERAENSLDNKEGTP